MNNIYAISITKQKSKNNCDCFQTGFPAKQVVLPQHVTDSRFPHHVAPFSPYIFLPYLYCTFL